MKKLIFLILFCILSVGALASLQVTYDFDKVKNVDVKAYNCADAQCSQLTEFYGYVESRGNSEGHTTDGTIDITLPSQLWQNGYALYFTSEGYLPLEIRSLRYGNGFVDAKCSDDPLYCFTKADDCKAEISNMKVLNVDKAFIPVTIEAGADLSSDIYSAFSNKRADPRYDIEAVPLSLRDVYYSADTNVKLEIYKNGDLVFEDTKYYDIANGNPIYMDSNVNPSWRWTPTEAGVYVAKITSEVTDNQCNNAIPQDAQEQFTVLEDEPSGMCYALLQGLRRVNSNGETAYGSVLEYEPIYFGFDYYSNHAENGSYSAVQMKINYDIKDDKNFSVASGERTLSFDNIGREQKSTFAKFAVNAPTKTGTYTVEVTGTPIGSRCNGLDVESNTQYINLNVEDTESYDTVFLVNQKKDSDFIAVADAEITLTDSEDVDEMKSTNSKGLVTFEDVEEGFYNYVVYKDTFSKRRGRMLINTNDRIEVVLNKDNKAPVINLPDQIRIQKDRIHMIDLDEYVSDDNDDNYFLSWNLKEIGEDFDSKTRITSDHVAQIVPDNTVRDGYNKITFEVTDMDGLKTEKTVSFILDSDNNAPEWELMPVYEFEEGETTKPRFIYLPAYVEDDYTPSTELEFSIEDIEFNYEDSDLENDVLEELLGLIIEDNYLSMDADKDFFGNVKVTVRAKDEKEKYADHIIEIIIENINDAPVVDHLLSEINVNEDVQKNIDISNVFFDADVYLDKDVDSLFYEVSHVDDVEIVVEDNASLTITPDSEFSGVKYFDLTAEDRNGEIVKIDNIKLNINSVNDAPWIVGLLSNVEFDEDSNGFELYLTSYERDLEDGVGPEHVGTDEILFWSAKDYDEELITVEITSEDYLTIVPVADAAGETTVTLVLTDSENNTAEHKIDVKVNNVNDAPVIGELNHKNLEINAENTIIFDITDIDFIVDNDEKLNLVLDIEPALGGWQSRIVDSEINGTVETFNLTFTPISLGDHTITVNVTDADGESDEKSFIVSVVDEVPPEFDVGSYSPINSTDFVYDPNFDEVFSVNVSDNDHVVKVFFEMYGPDNYYFGANAETTDFTSNPWFYNFTRPLDVGSYSYKFTAEDAKGNKAESDVIEFTISLANATMTFKLNGNESNIEVDQNEYFISEGALQNPLEGDLRIYVENIGLIKEALNSSNVSDNLSFSDVGQYNITLAFEKPNYNPKNITYTVTVNDIEKPAFNLETEVYPQNRIEDPSFDSDVWSIEITDNVGVNDSTVRLVFDGTPYNAAPLGNNTYEVSSTTYPALIGLAEGNYSFYWEATDVNGNSNNTIAQNSTLIISDDTENPIINITSSPDNGPYNYNSSAEYVWRVEITDNIGVNKLSPQLHVRPSGYDFTNYYLSYNETDKVYEKKLPKSAGSYDWYISAEDVNGNIASTNITTLIINKIDPSMILTLNTEDNNIEVDEFNNEVDIVGTLNIPVSGDLKLYVDSVEIASNPASSGIDFTDYQFDYQINPYLVEFEFVDTTGNYNDLTINHTVTVIKDLEAPQFSNENNPMDADYDSNANYTWNVTITDNVEVNDSTVKLVFNGTPYNATPLGNDVYEVSGADYPALAGLNVGDYAYHWEAKDTTGNSNDTISYNSILTISKSNPDLVLTLNGEDDDVSVDELDNLVDIIGTLNAPTSGDLKLYVDDVEIANNSASSNVSVMDYLFTVLDSPHVVKFEFTDLTGNYNNFNVSHTVTVTTLPVQSNYAVDGNAYTTDYNLEYTYFDLTFDTDVNTNCRWSLADESYADMTNNFAGAGTTSHSGTISGLNQILNVLQTVYVACEGEMSNSNDELTFNIINVLDGSTLTGTNTITSSFVLDTVVNEVSDINDSTIRTSTIDNSTVKTSTLTTCNVINSYVEGVTANNCNVIDSPHSAINVIGDNWTVSGDSTVTNSVLNNVTITGHSNVDHLTAENSILTNVNATDSNVTNSNLDNIILEDAKIVDYNITEGKITYTDGNGDQQTYDADVDGEKDISELMNLAPTASFTAPTVKTVNKKASFDASGSTDPNGDVLTYAWDFGDTKNGNGKQVTHTFTAIGTYTVTLTVTDPYGKSDSTSKDIEITKASTITTPEPTNRRTGGGGGGSSRMKTINVWAEGIQMSFQPLDLLRFDVNQKRMPSTVNVYQLDSGKATLLVSGIRHEVSEGETIKLDLDNDGIADISVEGISITNSLATLKFFPATGSLESTQTAQNASAWGLFANANFGMNAELQETAAVGGTEQMIGTGSTEEQTETVEENIEVNVEAGNFWDKIVSSVTGFFSFNDEATGTSSWIAMAIIAGVILIGLGIFFVIKKIYFY